MPLYRVVRVPAAILAGTRTDDKAAPVAIVLRNLLRFTGLTILLAACACTGGRRETTGTLVQASGDPLVNITILIPSGHDGDEHRYVEGIVTTLQVLGAWLVPFPDKTILVEPERTPWWTSAASMKPETAASRATVRRYFERLIDTRALPKPFLDALIEYATRRAVSKIVDRNYYAFYLGRAEERYFGRTVPRDLRVQIPVEGGANRMLQMLFTMERWVSRPVFDAILVEFVTSFTGGRPTYDDFMAVASRVSGQDLSWLTEALRTSRRVDYAVDSFESRPDAGAFRTTVTVRRLDLVKVPRPIPVITTFADGETVRERFDGNQRQETYEYRSSARAVSAEIDPDHLLVLDQDRRNNGLSLDEAAAATAANRWAARWMIWLQDAMLTYVALT